MSNLHNAAMAARTLKHWCGEVLKEAAPNPIVPHDMLRAIQAADAVNGDHLATCDCAEAKTARTMHAVLVGGTR